MKTYLCIVGVLYVLVLVNCKLTPEMESQLNECFGEFELTKESLQSPDFDNPKLKCFSACVMKKGDRLTNGKASIEKEIDLAKKYMPEQIDDALEEHFTGCVNSANEQSDDCEVAGSLVKCIFGKYKIPEV